MRTIIKPGPRRWEITCDHCATVFTYEMSDMDPGSPWVSCPVCHSRCFHSITKSRPA